MVSVLTRLDFDEIMARYASYENLATIVRHRFNAPKQMLRDLFSHTLFNVLRKMQTIMPQPCGCSGPAATCH